MKFHKAPWSVSLIVMSCLGTVVCAGASGITLSHLPANTGWPALLPLCVVSGAALFTIRGYSIEGNVLFVHRLLWCTRVPLVGVQKVYSEPNVMRRSIRLFGNGGLFSITGLFRNKVLGTYRAFVTDPKRAVVLQFPTRIVVVSPAEPELFVRDLTTCTAV